MMRPSARSRATSAPPEPSASLEEATENALLIAIAVGVLLPDQRIGRDSEERVEVVDAEGTEVEEISG